MTTSDRIWHLANQVNNTSQDVREKWADLGVALVRAEVAARLYEHAVKEREEELRESGSDGPARAASKTP
jgi:hypothetical protein